MPRVPLLLIKEQVLIAHEAHFAGGIHLFNSLSATLSQRFDVHVFTTARRGLVMHHALTTGLLGQLQRTYDRGELISWMNSCGVHFYVAIMPERSASQPKQEPASVGAMQQASSSSSSHNSISVHETLIAAVLSVTEHHHFKCKLLLDVDSLQHAVVSSCSSGSNYHASSTASVAGDASDTCDFRRTSLHPFMYALLQKFTSDLFSCRSSSSLCCQYQQQHQHSDLTSESSSTVANPPKPADSNPFDLLVLVQNIHHLPFGPCGTAPRTLEVLQAWCQISGVICVSHFVQGYLNEHVLPLIGLSSQRVYVMHPAAVGVFGKGPWSDLGIAAASKVWGCCLQQQQQREEGDEVPQEQQQGVAPQQQQQREEGDEVPQEQQQGVDPQQQQQRREERVAQQQQEEQEVALRRQQQQGQEGAAQQHRHQQEGAALQQQQQQQQQHKPVIGMLKCSREKGSDFLFALAEALPDYNFLAVCAEPEQLQVTPLAAGTRVDSSPAAAAAAAAAAARSGGLGLTNLRLIPPESDVSRVLRQMSVVLVPSVLHEAFGLVVLDALLHGIPVITSNAGALAEAAAGAAAAVVPVWMVEFTAATQVEVAGDTQDLTVDVDRADTGLPMTANDIRVSQLTAAMATNTAAVLTSPSCDQQQTLQRHSRLDQKLVTQWLASKPKYQEYPVITSNDLDSWVAAVKHVVSSRDVYLELSKRGREVAHGVVGSAEQQLKQLVDWIGVC